MINQRKPSRRKKNRDGSRLLYQAANGEELERYGKLIGLNSTVKFGREVEVKSYGMSPPTKGT